MKNDVKTRYKYLDIARGIAIILVVMGHCDNFSGYFSIEKFNGLFFMPLFMFISGYVSKEYKINSIKRLLQYLKKKIVKLYVFYLKWELIFLLLTNIFFKIGFYSSNISYYGKIILPINSFKILLKKIIGIIFLMGREPFCGAFWFIVSLIFIIIIFSFLNLFINNFFSQKSEKHRIKILGVISLILFLIGCIMNKTISIPRLSPALTLSIFYYFGFISNKYKEKIKFNNKIMVLFMFILLLVLYNFGSNAMNANSFPNGLFLLISSLSGIYVCMYISKYIEKNDKLSNLFSYIGQKTLPIVALHFISFKLIMLIQYSFGCISFDKIAYLKGYNNSNLWYFVYVIFGIFTPILLDYIFNYMKNYIQKEK